MTFARGFAESATSGEKSVKLADTPDSVHRGCPRRDRH